MKRISRRCWTVSESLDQVIGCGLGVINARCKRYNNLMEALFNWASQAICSSFKNHFLAPLSQCGSQMEFLPRRIPLPLSMCPGDSRTILDLSKRPNRENRWITHIGSNPLSRISDSLVLVLEQERWTLDDDWWGFCGSLNLKNFLYMFQGLLC